MIGEFIGNYGDVSALTILVGLMVWYFKHTTNRSAEREDKQDVERASRQEKRDEEQKEERDYYRNIIQGTLQKNVVLNAKSLSLQKKMMKDYKEHDGHSEKFSQKVVESLGIICGKMNGVDTEKKADEHDKPKK